MHTTLWHRDGTSIILSDDAGQLYILNTGQGESQKDAKYDQVQTTLNVNCCVTLSFVTVLLLMLSANLQFFLGDYRPLIQDTHGNVLDQVSWLLACFPFRLWCVLNICFCSLSCLLVSLFIVWAGKGVRLFFINISIFFFSPRVIFFLEYSWSKLTFQCL